MATQPQVRDAMQFVNAQDPATLMRFTERLELRGKDPTFVAYREGYLELIDLPRPAAVLDLGCGTGVVARALAARDGFAGIVTGIDQSAEFVAAAEGFAARDGVAGSVQFAVGDAHALEFPASSFDAAIAHTLVSHVRDPLAVITEAARRPPRRVRGRLRRRLPVDGGFAMGAVRRTTRSGAASCCHCWGYHAVRGAVARSRVDVRR
jgi:SAM-dependent methyltransferase